ncbi:MAG TPA: RecX family transcriptional regulator [Gemmatimonadales bacterium]|jgi:regulatory protein|nr:RecX family transcriptional regulator [Gemmatimonadales bacterium]
MTATLSEPRRVIGALAADPRRPGTIRVLVQGRPLLSVPREVAQAEGLAAGMLLEEPLYARLCRAADEEAAFRTALRFLERRPFATRDLTRRLVLKGHPPEAAAAAVERAGRAGLVDDARFALHYLETRAARGRGPLRLRRDLATLGVERLLVDRALRAAFGADGAGGPSAEAVARKRLAQLTGLPKPVIRRRLLAFLARRGFAGPDVSTTVAGLLDRRA